MEGRFLANFLFQPEVIQNYESHVSPSRPREKRSEMRHTSLEKYRSEYLWRNFNAEATHFGKFRPELVKAGWAISVKSKTEKGQIRAATHDTSPSCDAMTSALASMLSLLPSGSFPNCSGGSLNQSLAGLDQELCGLDQQRNEFAQRGEGGASMRVGHFAAIMSEAVVLAVFDLNPRWFPQSFDNCRPKLECVRRSLGRRRPHLNRLGQIRGPLENTDHIDATNASDVSVCSELILGGQLYWAIGSTLGAPWSVPMERRTLAKDAPHSFLSAPSAMPRVELCSMPKAWRITKDMASGSWATPMEIPIRT